MPASLNVPCRKPQVRCCLCRPVGCVVRVARIVADLGRPRAAPAAAAVPRPRPAGPREAPDPREPAVNTGADPADCVCTVRTVGA